MELPQTLPVKQKVTLENWTFCRYCLADRLAFISFGAELHPENSEEILEYYFVTLQNEEMQEFFQKKFFALEEACEYLNGTYDHWDFDDQMIASEGCGSCQAH